MLQFCQQSKTNPKDLLPLVQHNLANPSLLPLITDPQLLSCIDIQLSDIADCEFFIKHVLGRVRDPRQEELRILEEYATVTKEAHLKELAMILIERYRGQEMSVGWLLTKIEEEIGKKEDKELKYLLGTSVSTSFDPCKQLISFLVEVHQPQPWNHHKYSDALTDLINKAFIKLEAYAQHAKQYLNIVARLLRQTVTEDNHWVFLMFTMHGLVPKYSEYVATIVKRIDAIEDTALPGCFLSRAIFIVFGEQFRNEVYFDPNNEHILQPLPKIARQLFKPLRSTFESAHLGWVCVFSLDQLVLMDNFQKQLHICASLLRQRWFHEPQLVSECFCYIIVGFFQSCSITDSLPTLEGILGILTAKELKYVVLKLGSVLSQDKKQKIIEQCIKECGPNMRVLLYHFLSEKESKQLSGLKHMMQERYMGLTIEVEQSRYNSYQKQLKHFLELYNFMISHDLSSFQLTKIPGLHSLLTFYRHLLKQDYLSEQFWLNQEKLSLFITNTSNESLQIACEFIKDQKIFNLTGAMLFTAIANSLPSIPSTELISEVIDKLAEVCLQSLVNDAFASNITLSLQFIAAIVKVQRKKNLSKRILFDIESMNILPFLKLDSYGRVHYLVESIVIDLLDSKIHLLKDYCHLLPFYSKYLIGCQPLTYFNEHIQSIQSRYLSLGIVQISTSFTIAQYSSLRILKDNICRNFSIGNFRSQIVSIKDQFKFWSPIYRQEIVTLTYIKHSSEDNYYFKNHFNVFILMQYVRLLAKIDKKCMNASFVNELYQIAVNTLEKILKGDTLTHSRTFYQALVQSQIVYTLLTQTFLQLINPQQLTILIEICLDIIQKENYPLLRQQIEVVLCRTYLELNSKQPLNLMRQKFIAMLKVNINSGIPLALTLGYQLLRSQASQGEDAIIQIHQVLIKFISCHTAYLRAICQYYLYTYLESHPHSDPFLISISNYWRDDKDSQKILKNVAVVIQGFKEAVQGQKDFIGFERVEQYASNRVKLEIYRSLSLFYSEDIVGEIIRHQSTDKYLYQGFCNAVKQRCQQMKRKYLELFSIIRKNPEQAFVKSNMKCRNEQRQPAIEEKAEKPAKQHSKKKKKHQNKNKRKNEQEELTPIQDMQEEAQPSLSSHFHHRLRFYKNLKFISHWHRKDLNPTIIVIATLLQKVHNFGHILRTLHSQNAWLVVPSELPLIHPQCTELIPSDCDVPIVEIKQRDIHKFILLMKSLGYPLVALQQCSRSVQIESAAFPDNFMLLLGNERLGAPGWLLDEGDLLVQIPQVGKIRSLNVHVSMVLCVWQYLTQSK